MASACQNQTFHVFWIPFFFRDLVPYLSSFHHWVSLQHFRKTFFNHPGSSPHFPSVQAAGRASVHFLSLSPLHSVTSPFIPPLQLFPLKITQTSYLLFLLGSFQYLPSLTSTVDNSFPFLHSWNSCLGFLVSFCLNDVASMPLTFFCPFMLIIHPSHSTLSYYTCFIWGISFTPSTACIPIAVNSISLIQI